MIIRKATQEDLPGINKLLEIFLAESFADYHTAWNKEHIYKLVDTCLANTFVAVNGEVVGAITGAIVPSLANGELIFQEIMWYVKKEHRTCGVKLLQAIENFCKENGVKKITVAHLGNTNPEKIQRFYERLGFKLLESQYIKEIS